MITNYSLQDIFGSLLAFIYFPLIFVFPGYSFAWLLDIFSFRHRLLFARLAISVVISAAISPILVFLAYRLGSANLALAILVFWSGCCTFLVWREKERLFRRTREMNNVTKIAAWIFSGWSLLAIASLIDIQCGQRLYFSMVAFDFTSRISIVDAITRTGVPPVNPGYFVGKPEHLTFLYYFWYVLCSLIDYIGGNWINARMALIASVAWSGIGLMCVLALYLRLRNSWSGVLAWKNALMGIGMLSISGLDIYPALIFMIGTRFAFGYMWPVGDMEHWNERITAWTSAVLWAPHHVAGLVVCLTGFLLIQTARKSDFRRQLGSAIVAGLAFASATGLSIWMTFTFALFLGVWILVLFLQREYQTVLMILLTGISALVANGPFLGDLLGGGSPSAAGVFPIMFQMRSFTPLLFFLPFMFSASSLIQNLVNLFFLPINYFLELGFYFVIAWLWLSRNIKNAKGTYPYYVPEILLLSVVFLVSTFLRSTASAFNDLGWRSWLFGQFVLLIWALDLGQEFLAHTSLTTYFSSKLNTNLSKHGQMLAKLLLIGIATTIFSLFTLRAWGPLTDLGITGVPSFMSPDLHLGERTFSGREAYDFIRDNLPKDVIVQYNPAVQLDRPSGLYGTHQLAVADYSAYGVPVDVFQAFQHKIEPIFQNVESGWLEIDQICAHHYIDVIILNDQDPIWRNLPALASRRQPLYRNAYYAVFACADFSKR